LSGPALAWALILYGGIAASLPVWLMLAPRDYLSTFLKIGTLVALAIGIYVVMPHLAMPATTRFIDGSGPVFSGSLFPFLFITITPDMINQTAADIGENTILSRAGGAPTLAVGMAQILAQALGGKTMEAFWYHFAILFEALFILTAVDAGTRVGRFMIQDMLG